MRTTGGGRGLARIVAAGLLAASVVAFGAQPAAAATPSCTYNGEPSAVTAVTPGALVTVICTGLAPLQHVTINEESPLAAIVQPAASAPFEAGGGTAVDATVDADGALLMTFTIPAS